MDHVRTTIFVNYEVLNNKGRVINTQYGSKFRHVHAACFSGLTYSAIPKQAHTIHIWHSIKQVPYPTKIISKWIREINELGFPCYRGKTTERYYHFIIKLADYKYKAHLVSTLMLIRALYETCICHIPNTYFKLIGRKPKANKFDVLQTAHKTKSKSKARWGMGPNTNHMITYARNGGNITKATLFRRYKESASLYNKDYTSQHSKWRGAHIG